MSRRAVMSRAALAYAAAGAAPSAPVAITPTGRWHFFAAPDPASRPLRVPAGLGLTRLAAGCWVPAPPSDRGPAGRDRWLVSPRHRLPEPSAVAAALLLAAAWSPAYPASAARTAALLARGGRR